MWQSGVSRATRCQEIQLLLKLNEKQTFGCEGGLRRTEAATETAPVFLCRLTAGDSEDGADQRPAVNNNHHKSLDGINLCFLTDVSDLLTRRHEQTWDLPPQSRNKKHLSLIFRTNRGGGVIMSSCQGAVPTFHTLLKSRKVFYCCVEESNFAEQIGVKPQITRCVNEKWNYVSFMSWLQHFPNSASISSSIDHISPEWTLVETSPPLVRNDFTSYPTANVWCYEAYLSLALQEVVLWLRGCRFNFSFNPMLCINGWLWLWCKVLWVWKSYKFKLVALKTELIAFRATRLILWQSGPSGAQRGPPHSCLAEKHILR